MTHYLVKKLTERKDDPLFQEAAIYIEMLHRYVQATCKEPQVLHLLGLDKGKQQ